MTTLMANPTPHDAHHINKQLKMLYPSCWSHLQQNLALAGGITQNLKV